MIVKYTGPRTGGITQIGRVPVQVPHDTPVELPDALAQVMLDQHPDDWSEVDAPAKKKTKPPAKASAAADQPEEGEAS